MTSREEAEAAQWRGERPSFETRKHRAESAFAIQDGEKEYPRRLWS